MYSRAYLRFSTPQDVFGFTQELDGHAFLTQRGTQFRCACAPADPVFPEVQGCWACLEYKKRGTCGILPLPNCRGT